MGPAARPAAEAQSQAVLALVQLFGQSLNCHHSTWMRWCVTNLGYHVGTPVTRAVKARSSVAPGDDRLGLVLVRTLGSDLGISYDEERGQTERRVVTLRVGTDNANLASLPSHSPSCMPPRMSQ